MAATASNTELPGTAVIITTSLGPDWHHDKLVSVLWRTWFAASTQPILLRMGPDRYRFSRHCFGLNVTVCALLRVLWSWVHSLLLVPLECCCRWEYDTTLFDGYSESRCYCTHITTLHSTSTKTPREITKVFDPNGGLKSVTKAVCITAQVAIVTRLLHSQARCHKHVNWKSLSTHCLPIF
jgi:hypothetical protein